MYKSFKEAAPRYNRDMNAPATAPSFAELCYRHTFSACGCGMCKAGDVCPMPVLKLVDVHGDPEAVSERTDMIQVEALTPAK